MQVSQIVKKNLEIDSQSFKDLSPLMKEAVSDVFKLIEKETGDIITRFENSVNKVAEFHNINSEKFNDYFDKEKLEQLGEE